MEQGLPVDVYIGGVEHAVMHLLYARFVAKFLVDDGVIDPLGCAMPNGEPFTKLVSQGLVKTDTFSDAQGRYTATPSKVRRVEKMSKSKMNGVDPTSVIDSYGSDVARLYILSKASPQDPIIWDIKGVVGMDRWMRRLWALLDECWPELFGRRESVMKSADEIPHIEVAWPLVDDSVVCSGSGDICDKYTRLVGGHFGQMRLHLCITELLKMTREITEIQISNEKELGAKRNACIRLLELLLPFAPRTSSHILSRLAQLNARLNRTE